MSDGANSATHPHGAPSANSAKPIQSSHSKK